MTTWLRHLAVVLVLGGALTNGPLARADASGSGAYGGSAGSSAPTTDYERGRDAALAGRYAEAIVFLRKAVATVARHADAHNMLGFSYRKQGDYRRAFASYEKALSLDPYHKGAHEYIGQAYVERGNLTKAREHLAHLARLCRPGCEPHEHLKAAIDARAAGKPRPRGNGQGSGYGSDERG